MKRLLLGATVAVTAAALVAIGRVERERHGEDANDGIERVYETVGTLDAPNLAGFRMKDAFQCLIYRANARTYGLELCVDREGRVIEAYDRRDGELRVWSVRDDPELARVRVDRHGFEGVIERMCEECARIFERARSPGGQAP